MRLPSFKAVFPVLLAALLALPLGADPARDNRWRDDLTFLATELPKRHPNLFFQLKREDFDHAVDQLSRVIPELTDAEIVTGMARIAAMAGDGHTSLPLTQQAAGFRRLPFVFYWYEDGVFVTQAASAYKRALGARVIQIGDQDAQQALLLIASVISHENDAWVRHNAPGYLALADLLQALKIAPNAAAVRLVLQDRAGSRFEIEAPSAAGLAGDMVAAPDRSNGFTPLYRRSTDQNYWFTYLASARTLYFRYNRCQEMPALPFARFADQLFAEFDAKPVDRLVVDFRDNGGGNSQVIRPFFDGLRNRLARFGSPTRFYAIIGRGVFSSAVMNAEELKDAQVNLGFSFIRLVGEPTGGKPAHYGEVQSFALPNSRLVLSHSTKLFSSPFNTDSLLPDVTAPIFSSDYFARHDPFLAAVLADEVNQP